jgi:hypothetical protein
VVSQVDICLGIFLEKVWKGANQIRGWILQNIGKFAKAGNIEESLLILKFKLDLCSSPLVAQEFRIHTFDIYVTLAFRLLDPIFMRLASLVMGRVIFRFRHNKLL